MIGSIALWLPYLALRAGFLASAIIIFTFGCAMSFSSWIYSQHLGDQPDIGHSLSYHFISKFWAKFLYDFVVWIHIICLSIEYFQLIVQIWKCIIITEYDKYYFVSSAINFGVLFAFIWLLRKKNLGAKAMIYGIISIFQYLLFLLVYFFDNSNKPTIK